MTLVFVAYFKVESITIAYGTIMFSDVNLYWKVQQRTRRVIFSVRIIWKLGARIRGLWYVTPSFLTSPSRWPWRKYFTGHVAHWNLQTWPDKGSIKPTCHFIRTSLNHFRSRFSTAIYRLPSSSPVSIFLGTTQL